MKELPPDVAAAYKQLDADQRRVTVRQANLLHRHFIDTMIDALPLGTMLYYDGVLATERDGNLTSEGHFHRLRIETEDPYIGSPLDWGVGANGFGIFQINVTTAKTKFTLAKCSIEGQEFFANVPWVTGLASVDDKLRELGGRSVRQVLSKIEVPLAKPHYAPPRDEKPAGK